MKIAIVLPGGVDRSGEDRVIHSRLWLIERLARRHEVHVYATRQEPEPAEWELFGARVHNLGTARGTFGRLVAQFSAEHGRARFDVVHGFFGWPSASAALAGWRCRVPMLFHPSGGEFVAMRDIAYGMRLSWRERIAVRVATKGARRVTVATPYMQQLAATCGVRAEVVPLGVALDRWPPAPPRRRDPAEPLRMLHVGDVRSVKDQHLLIAAATRLTDAGLQFELDVAGLGTQRDDFLGAPEAKGLGDRLRGHGVLRHDALRALVDRAHVFVCTSRHEAGPLVVLEAAVAGVPTVGTSVGHIADWAPHAAVAVPVGDDAALARELTLIASDEPRRLALAHAAQERALAIDADFTAAEFERIYGEMVIGR